MDSLWASLRGSNKTGMFGPKHAFGHGIRKELLDTISLKHASRCLPPDRTSANCPFQLLAKVPLG